MSGVGRGRGWLNIKNGGNKPGGVVNTENTHYVSESLNNYEDANKYKDIIGLIRQLNVHDDGIMQNRKLGGMYQQFATEFKNDEEIRDCCQHLYKLGLRDETIATNFAWMMSMKPFIVKPIYEIKLRDFLINELQECYSKARQMQMSEPKEFRNFVRIMARFTRAKLADGSSMKVFAKPVTQCLEMLLDTGKPEDIECFIEQFNVSFLYLQDTSPEDVTGILNKIRVLLIKNELATCKCRARLLLALELSEKGTLPVPLYKFYSEQLGDKAMSDFQVSNTPLTIQLPPSNIQECNKNEVSALPTNMENNLLIKDNAKNTVKQHSFKPSYNEQPPSDINHSMEKCPSPIGNWDAHIVSPPKEKTGRPILGAGVRFNTGNSENWRGEDQSKKQYQGWEKSRKNLEKKFGGSSKPNKAWQHDDRFDTDYN